MTFNIDEYKGTSLLCELAVRLLDSSLMYQTLKKRGRKFVKLNGIHYMAFGGMAILKTYDQGRELRVTRFPVETLWLAIAHYRQMVVSLLIAPLFGNNDPIPKTRPMNWIRSALWN
jgi:hypothetical protein